MIKFEKSRVSWSSVFAGLLIATVMFIATLQIGALITAMLPLSLLGTSISAFIWLIISLLASAYVAGMFCMMTQNVDEKFVTIESTPEEIEATTHRFRKNTKIHGIVVGAAIVVITTFMSVTGLTAAISGLSNVLSITAKTTAVATVGGVAGIASIEDVQNYLQNVSQNDIEILLAKEIPELDKAQVSAVVDVVGKEFNKAGNYLASGAVYNLPENVGKAYNYIKYVFVENNGVFTKKLQNEGLTQAQSNQVVNVINKYISEVEAKIEELKKAAEEATRKTVIYATLIWLITSSLILIASVCGANSMNHTETTHQAKKAKKK
ncbi:hypothetical protein DLH72_03570 [Candidatus Gracilibacteria bacterium]|nr:MAG: hypothetical protein DLH72_03570 [Candidatus Gracilibacteria bacterium]